MYVFLETERLILRRVTAADADDLFALDNDPDVMRFLNGGKPASREAVDEGLALSFRFYERYAGFGRWAAVEKSTGAFLGTFALGPGEDDGPGVVEIGYRLHRSAWGVGYATEVARALLRKAFTEFGVGHVRAYAMAVNTPSRRVMEKAGMTHVRTFPHRWADPRPGMEHGKVEYALTRDEWERREAAATARP